MEVLRLSESQQDALRHVDLRLAWVRHGLETDWSEHGPAILGVSSRDYEISASMLHDMGSGDVSARERRFQSCDKYDEPTVTGIIDEIGSTLYRSPYILPDIKSRLSGFLLDYVDNQASKGVSILIDEKLIERMKESMELTARLRMVSVFGYVDAHALTRGVSRAIADLPFVRDREGSNMALRAQYMTSKLGDIAVNMTSKVADVKPKLLFTAGKGHKEDVESIFSRQGIPFTSLTRPPERIPLIDHIRTFFRPETYREVTINRMQKQWIKNLKEHGFGSETRNQ